jgi:CheY-like chemotaxis protein
MKYTLLIVEDDPSSRQLMHYMLNKLDLDSFGVDTGEAALDTIKENDVAGFLLDIALGNGIDGLELGEQIKSDQRFADTPMIAVTAYDRKSLGNLKEIGFTGYLQKPFSKEKLKALLSDQELKQSRKKKLTL